MGNYKNLEVEFVERTLKLISQYEIYSQTLEFKEQYNYTLLVNCLLGLIVLPKEKTLSYLPKARITDKLKKEIGIEYSVISNEITQLKHLILELRNSIAHFDIKIQSETEEFLIDNIIFYNEDGNEVITFKSNEVLPFMRYYSSWLLSNLKNK